MRIKTHLDNTLYLSSLWSDLSKWGHFFKVLNLRKPNLRSSLSQLSDPELVTAGAQMFIFLPSLAAINPDLHLLQLEGLKAINSGLQYSDYWLLFIWDKLTIVRLTPAECNGHKSVNCVIISLLSSDSVTRHTRPVTLWRVRIVTAWLYYLFITDVHCFGHPNITGIFQ